MGENLKNIIEGYSNLVNKDSDIEALAEIRREICNGCERNSNSLVPYCKECGCVIAAKTRVRETECPLKKW